MTMSVVVAVLAIIFFGAMLVFYIRNRRRAGTTDRPGSTFVTVLLVVSGIALVAAVAFIVSAATGPS